jgi:hypothetical protein
LILIVTLFFLSNKYQDELEKLTISRINQEVDTKINIGDINVSFVRTFPYLSLVFQDVIVWSSHTFQRQEFSEGNIDTDTLFTAEKLYIQFNPIDLLRSNTRIKRIYAVKGKLNMLVDSEGGMNYSILKKKTSTEKNKSRNDRAFELEALRLSDFSIVFTNLFKKTFSSSHLDNMMLKGKISHNEFALGTNTRLTLHDFTRNGFRYANNYDISLKLILEVKDKLAKIKKGEINLNTIKLETWGEVLLGKNPSFDLQMESRNIHIATLLSSFPSDLREKLPFRTQGRGDLAVKINGPITRTQVPSIDAVYVLRLDQFNFMDQNFRNIRLKGDYSNGDRQRPSTTEIKIQKYRIQDRNSDIEGSINIENLVKPSISLEMKGTVDAAKLSDWFLAEKGIEIKGTFLPDFILRTKASSFKEIKLESLSSAGLSGELGISELSFKTPAINEIKDINGLISFAGDSWFPELSINYEDINLEIKAQLDYVLNYLTGKDQILWINAITRSENLDLNKIMRTGNKKEANEERKTTISLPQRIAGKVYLEVDQFHTGDISGSEMKASFHYKPGRLDLSAYELITMEGKISGNGSMIQNKDDVFYLISRNEMDHINIRQLFQGFKNFGQDNLRSEHLGGYLSGSVDFNAVFDSTLTIQKNKIFTDADISIKSGELIGFEPAEKLSGFLELEELEHIQFSELKNTILIQNNQMTIPEMDINSNAFNITASGIHNFNGIFDYKMKILLSEILTNKARKKNENFYVMEDNRRASLYLSIYGTANDYKIKYDRKEAISAIKEDIKKEKNTLKTILNEEFGWFKKDSLSSDELKSRDKPDLILEWEEDSVSNEKDTGKGLFKKKKNKAEEVIFEIEWEEDDG